MVEPLACVLRGLHETKVEIGDPYQRIIAASRGMDAIVMSTAGRTGLSHLLIGSVTEKVVRHSTVRPFAPDAARAGLKVKQALDALGLKSFPKTSGRASTASWPAAGSPRNGASPTTTAGRGSTR